MNIERLKKEDFSDLISLLNEVFTAHNKREMDFESLFPRIFKPDDKKMSWHLGAKIGNELCGTAASYPLAYKVGGEELKISAGGNIAVKENARGKGVMQTLLNTLDEEDRKEGFDISYLHGDRARYSHFGYEKCGVEYVFDFPISMFKKDELENSYKYVDLRNSDKTLTKRVFDFYNNQTSYLIRNCDEFLDSLTAKKKKPVAVLDENDCLIAYFCINNEGEISEIHIRHNSDFSKVIKGYMKNESINTISISLPSFSPLMNEAKRFCGRYRIIQPANFKIFNFKKVTECFMREKCAYEFMPDGKLTIDSDIFGKWEIKKRGNAISVSEFTGDAEIKLIGYSVYQFIFGPSAPVCDTAQESSILLARLWFPLPLFCPYLT